MFDSRGAQPSWSEVWADDWRQDSAATSVQAAVPSRPKRTRNAAVVGAARAVDMARVALADSVVQWDDEAAWSADGARSAGAWLRANLGMSYGHGIGVLRLARTFHRHPILRDAVVDGRLSWDKAEVIGGALSSRLSFYADRDLTMLIDQVAPADVRDAMRMIALWRSLAIADLEYRGEQARAGASGEASPGGDADDGGDGGDGGDGDDADTDREPATEGRETEPSTRAESFDGCADRAADPNGSAGELYASETYGGVTRLDGTLDPEAGLVVRAALAAAMGMPEPGSAPDPTGTDESGDAPRDTRSPAQQRADALVVICQAFLDHHEDIPTAGGEGPHLQVTVDLDVLAGAKAGAASADLLAKATLSAETARRIACDANVHRIIVKGGSLPLDVGRASRTANRAQRRAVVHRDRCCRFPGCDMRARYCQVHHCVHWTDGGPTDLCNLVLLCWRHHRLVHHGWHMTGEPNRELMFVAPDGTRYTSRPPPRPETLGW